MSFEEDLFVLSGVVAAQKERIADLEQLIRDFDAFLDSHYPHTYNNENYGILLQQRIAELGVLPEKKGNAS